MMPTADEQKLGGLDALTPRVGVVAIVGAPGAGGRLVARLLGALGLEVVGVPGDQPGGPDPGGAGPDQPAVTGVADQVLAALQGTWWAPGELSPGWPDRPELRGLVPIAAAALEPAVTRVVGDPGSHGALAWWEPAGALVLPFWRRHLGVPRAAVVVWRRPESAVDALVAEGIGTVHALALWETYTVHALAGTAGLPVLGLDVDDLLARPANVSELSAFLVGLEMDIPADAVSRMADVLAAARAATPTPVAARDGTSERPSTGGPVGRGAASGAELVLATQGGALRAATGIHAPWEPPVGLAVGPWSAAVLAGQRAAHRSAAEAVGAWVATDEAQVIAEEAQLAAERRFRALAGPDPMHYLELRRELVRLRDEVLGLQAERDDLVAQRQTAEQRVEALIAHQTGLEEIRLDRDAILGSRTWQAGRLIVGPLRRLRRLLGGRR